MRRVRMSSLALGWIVVSCSSGPVDDRETHPRLPAGNVVAWASQMPALGSVRWGRAPGEYTRVAYPQSENRVDLRRTTEHRVSLLTPRPGDVVYFQTMSHPEEGPVIVGGRLWPRHPPARPGDRSSSGP